MSTVTVGSDGRSAEAGDGVEFYWPNQALLQVLREIERIQDGMPVTSGDNSLGILREARAGAMYGMTDGGQPG